MSDSEATPTIRRSGRDRKPAKPFTQDPAAAASRKRKRDTDDEEGNTTDKHTSNGEELDEEHHEEPEDEEDLEDYLAPKSKSSKAKKQPGASKTKVKAPTTKKPRALKAKGATGARKGKTDASVDVVKQIKDSHISDDNALFNAILNPSAALQSTAEDYLESLAQSPGLALADLINCILRACGCNESVDADQVMDSDGIVDVLDTFTEGLKQGNTPLYPLASRLPVFKKFHKQLSEFLDRLITSSAELGSLYTSDLLPTLQSWVVAMSSSQLRSLRHTATVVAMELESALCEVAAEVEKVVAVVARQREGEKKRAGKDKGKRREKEFEGKAEEVRERKNKLTEYLREFFDGVFVHRYRDHDPGIRAECVQAMGVWLKRHPAQFLEGSYLRYVGWVLSDGDTHVRLEAVKSLHSLYDKTDYISMLQHFTDRFKGRLVQMATSDLELPVRVAVIQVLVAIDSHSLLEDEQRDELCLLVYDEEPRVRKAVAGFVRGVWEEAVEERMVGRKSGGDKGKEKERVGIKCLATLLVKWGKRTGLGHAHGPEEDEDEESPVEESKNKDVARLVSAHHKGRIALAVEALWDEVDAIGDWEALLEHLLLDHSASAEDSVNGVGPSPVAARRRQNAATKKKAVDEEVVDEAWRLTEPEEAALLEVFVATLRKAKEEATGGKKGEEETMQSDMTRALIKGLPRLFAKHQTDSNRVADVLLIPQLMNVDLYLEMRMIPAYEGLWDDVTKQFLSHSSPVVLGHANATIQHFMSATLLSNTNSSKIVELEEELSTSLRDAVAGRDELEVASFSEDEVHALGAIASRLVVLSTVRDMTSWMEEDEGGKQSSAWDIISALADRGRLGYKEEEAMIDECLRLLTYHLAWKGRGLSLEAEPNEDEIRYMDTLKEQRESLLEKVTEDAVGSQSDACEGVKRAAFHNLLDIYILFSDSQSDRPDGVRLPPTAMPLRMDDETQYRCAGFVQAEIEQFVDDLERGAGGEKVTTTEDESSRVGSASEEDEGAGKKSKKTKKTKTRRILREDSPDPRTLPRSRLEREYVLNALLATFIRAIRVGVLNPGHGAVVLAHYDRLGSGFDTSIKVVVDFLRDLGMFKDQGQVVAGVIVQALQEAFNLFLDDSVHVDDHVTALARALSSCFVIRGAQLAVIKRLESDYVVEIHTSCVSWIVKRISAYESTNNKKMRIKAILFFRVLQQLLTTVESRDALKIKAHSDQALAQAKVEVNTTKAWDPYRAYEKRLSTAMSKDKSLPTKSTKGKRTKKNTKSADLINSDEEEAEVAGLVSGSGTEGDEADPPPRPKPRPKPRPVLRRAGSASEGNEGDDEDVFGPVSSPKLSSPPKRRSGRKVLLKDTVALSQDDLGASPNHEENPEVAQESARVGVNGHQSPPETSKKRRRDDNELEDSEGQENNDPSAGLANRAPSPSQSHISVADVKNRRKRVRR